MVIKKRDNSLFLERLSIAQSEEEQADANYSNQNNGPATLRICTRPLFSLSVA